MLQDCLQMHTQFQLNIMYTVVLEEIQPKKISQLSNLSTIFKESKHFMQFPKHPSSNYPPYECKLFINFNKGYLSIIQSMSINQYTTFRNIVDFSIGKVKAKLKEQLIDKIVLQSILNQLLAQSSLKNLQLEDEYDKIIQSDLYPLRLSQTQHSNGQAQYKHFTLRIYSGSCVFPIKSLLMLNEKSISIQQYIKIKNMEDKASLEILAFDRIAKKIIKQKRPQLQFSSIKQVKSSLFLAIQMRSQENKWKVFFYKRTLVMKDDYQWVHVESLVQGAEIYGMSKIGQAIKFQILKISQLEQSDDFQAVSISSPKFHNLIIDRVIVHNMDTINVICNFICQNRKVTLTKKIFHDARVDDQFKGKTCYFAGKKIEAGETFADYFIKDNDILYIFDDESIFQEIAISVRNKGNYYCKSLHEISNFIEKFKDDYLGINTKQILSFEQAIYDNNLPRSRDVSHIIISRRSVIERINYYRFVQPRYKQYETQLLQRYQHDGNDAGEYRKQVIFDYEAFKAKFVDQHQLDQQRFFALHLYTSNRIYRELNSFLRDQYGKAAYSQLDQKWVATTGWIIKSLQCLRSFSGVCYRGIYNVSLKDCLGIGDNNESICFRSFTSTSTSSIIASQRFSNQKGVVLTIHSRSGRDITHYSRIKVERQILISPFTHFLILNYNEQSAPQTAQLEEIPLPSSDSDQVIFWVDDNPYQNDWLVDKLKQKGIQVVQVVSTTIMRIIIRQFLWIYKIMGKHILIITDMKRVQNGTMNEHAGTDILSLLYKHYGISVKSIVYGNDVEDCQKKIKQRQIFSEKIIVLKNPNKLIEKILQEFFKNK